MIFSSLVRRACPERFKPHYERIARSPLARKLASGVFWSLGGTGLSKMLVFLALILTARVLGAEIYGEFGFIRSTALSFMTISSFGIGTAATKYIAELLASDKERTGRIIGLCYVFTFLTSFVVAVLFYTFAPWICETKLNVPHLVREMRLGAVLLFFLTLMTTQVGVMSGFQDFRGIATASFVSGLLSVPLYVGGAWYGGLGGSLFGLLLATLLNVVVNSCFIFRNVRRHRIRYSFFQSYKELGTLWSFCLPMFLCWILVSGTNWLCQCMLTAYTVGSAELGIFFAAMTCYPMIVFLPEQVSNVFLPMLSESTHPKDATRFKKLIFLFVLIGLLSVLGVLIPTIVFRERIMALFGSEFASGGATLIVLGVAAMVYVVGHSANLAVASRGKIWFMLLYNLVGAVATLGFSYWLIVTGWGSLGAALGFLAGLVARFFVIVPLTRSYKAQ